MSSADSDSKSSSASILQRGKLALESLQFREEAARIHAARIDLQAALEDAESGSADRLQNWLSQYQPLLDSNSKHAIRHSIESSSFDRTLVESSVSRSLRVDAPVAQSLMPARTDLEEPTTIGALIVKAPVSESIDVPLQENRPEHDFPRAKRSPWDAMMEAAMAREQAAMTMNSTSDALESPAELLPLPADKGPILTPDAIRAKRQLVLQKKESETKLKKLLWLSPALLWSMGAHLVALVGMSAYVITMATRTEPMAIISSPVETETVSMETPTEMIPSEVPELETTSTSTPDLPTVATPIASASTSSVVLPTSIIGDAPSEMPSALGSTIGDAIGSAMNALPATTGAQFFGVNATGNTFCYIVDRSGSMRGGAFEAAKEEIVRSLSTMKPKQRFYIFFFGEEIEGMRLNGREEETYPVYATRENIEKTIQWMDRVKIQSGKHPGEVIARAIEMEPDGIFLLFDGETTVDLGPRIRKSNQIYDLVLGEQTRVPIHSVCFYTENPEAQKLMKTIADQNLGTYRYVPKPPGAGVGKRRVP